MKIFTLILVLITLTWLWFISNMTLKMRNQIEFLSHPMYKKYIEMANPVHPNRKILYIHFGFEKLDEKGIFYIPIYTTSEGFKNIFYDDLKGVIDD